MVGLGDRRDVDDVGPTRDRDRVAHGRRRREIHPVAVCGLEQLAALVFRSGIQPQAPSGKIEMTPVFAYPALAQIDDLLALEERMDDRGPFLERGCGRRDLRGGGHAGQDTGDVTRSPGSTWRTSFRKAYG